MQFGADQCSEVQWLSCMVLSSSIQSSAVWWSQAQTKKIQSSEVWCRPLQSSELLSGSVQSGPVHKVESAPVQSSLVQSNPVRSRPIPVHSFPAKYISIQRSPGPCKSIAVESSQVQCKAVQSVRAQPSPVPSSREQLIATQSRTPQSCSVELGTTTCIAARPFKWDAIPKSPHLSPYKCISVQCCLQLSHQHKEERLLTLS